MMPRVGETVCKTELHEGRDLSIPLQNAALDEWLSRHTFNVKSTDSNSVCSTKYIAEWRSGYLICLISTKSLIRFTLVRIQSPQQYMLP